MSEQTFDLEEEEIELVKGFYEPSDNTEALRYEILSTLIRLGWGPNSDKLCQDAERFVSFVSGSGEQKVNTWKPKPVLLKTS